MSEKNLCWPRLLKKQTALMELIANTAEIISMRACVNVHTAAKLIDVSVVCLMRQLADEIVVFFLTCEIIKQ